MKSAKFLIDHTEIEDLTIEAEDIADLIEKIMTNEAKES